MRYIINILIVDVSLFIQSSCKSMKNWHQKSQYFGIFHHLAKCQNWAFLATVQDKMEWREIVLLNSFMTLNGLYNNMVSWVLLVIL